MKMKHALMAVALIGSAGLALFGDKQPDGAVLVDARQLRVDQSARHTAPDNGRTARQMTAAGPASSVLPLRPRQPEAAASASQGGTLFQAQSWVQAQAPADAAAEPPPQAPPLPLSYLGVLEDDKHQINKVLLANGDKTHIVAVNDVIEEQYKVISITRQAIVLEYLPLHQQQTLSTQ